MDKEEMIEAHTFKGCAKRVTAKKGLILRALSAWEGSVMYMHNLLVMSDA